MKGVTNFTFIIILFIQIPLISVFYIINKTLDIILKVVIIKINK